MTMTRSDYQVVAETIKQLGGLQEHFESYEHLLEVMARSLASSLAITNPRFDEDKFLVACGVPTQKKEK